MTHWIDAPGPDDAGALGRLLVEAWLQTYPNAAAGIDEAWIRENRGFAATPEGIAGWREFIENSARRPDAFFCRVVRAPGPGARPVGVLCGRRREGVSLGPMYLLAEAQGQGIGGRLMAEFDAWAGGSPVHLWVTEYNEGAVRFYERHGFRPTGERELWRGRLPNVRMVRATGRPGARGA